MSEFEDMQKFFGKCSSAGNGDFKRALSTFLEGIGLEFLRVIQDEIIRRKVMDTRHLLKSFHKGGGDNIWELSEGDITLEVGTNASYATYVNDGHWTCEKGQAMRFIPGKVEKGTDGRIISFEYQKGAKTGIMLKQKWVQGAHFWESGLKIIERMLPGLLEKKVAEWMESYFR